MAQWENSCQVSTRSLIRILVVQEVVTCSVCVRACGRVVFSGSSFDYRLDILHLGLQGILQGVLKVRHGVVGRGSNIPSP